MLYTVNYLAGEEQYFAYAVGRENLFMLLFILENNESCSKFVVGTFDCLLLARDFGFKEFTKWKQGLFEAKIK